MSPRLIGRLLLICASLVCAPAQGATEEEIAALAKRAASGRDIDREELEKLANGGEALAAQYLGILHLNGRGVRQSDELALKWFLAGAKLGRADSAHNA